MKFKIRYLFSIFTLSILSGCTQHVNNATAPSNLINTKNQIQNNSQAGVPVPPQNQLQLNQPVSIAANPTFPNPSNNNIEQLQQNTVNKTIADVVKGTPFASNPSPQIPQNQAKQITQSNTNELNQLDTSKSKSQDKLQQKSAPKPISVPADLYKSPVETNSGSVSRLSLEEAFTRADTKNPQLLAASKNLDINAAGITIAGARQNPQIGLQYGFGSAYSTAGNPQQISLNQTVELGGKRSKRLSVAKAQYELTVFQYDATRFDIHNQVRRAYAELAAAQASYGAQQEQILLLKRLVYISNKRFQAGAAPEAELLQAQLALNQIEPQLRQATGRIQTARIALNALLGDASGQIIETTDTGIFPNNNKATKTELVPPSNSIPSVELLVALAYEKRLDFKAAQKQSEVAQQQLRLNKAMRVPDLQLSGGYLFTNAQPPTPNTNGVFLGVNVNLPIFYNQQGEIAQAKATLEQSKQQENVVKQQIATDVNTAYEALLVARDKIYKYQSKLLPDSREVLKLAEESYQVGKTNLASAIVVEQADQQNRSAYVDAITAYQSAYADLEKAVGTQLEF